VFLGYSPARNNLVPDGALKRLSIDRETLARALRNHAALPDQPNGVRLWGLGSGDERVAHILPTPWSRVAPLPSTSTRGRKKARSGLMYLTAELVAANRAQEKKCDRRPRRREVRSGEIGDT